MRACVLHEEKQCDGCGECNRCDLDPAKVCDNCCACIAQTEEAFARIQVADIVTEQAEEYLHAFFPEEETHDAPGE